MKALGVIPIILSLGALVLSTLCLFAGARTSFLPDMALVTLNSSAVGLHLVPHLTDSNPIVAALPKAIQGTIDTALASTAKELGIHDFYTLNLLNYCEGFYVSTTGVPGSEFKKNFSDCSKPKFAPNVQFAQVIQTELGQSGLGSIDVRQADSLNSLDTSFSTVTTIRKAAAVMYCIAVGFTLFASIFSAIACCMSDCRATVHVLFAGLSAFTLTAVSALMTTIAVHGSRLINHHGANVGLNSTWGGQIITFTWLATFAMLACTIWWRCLT